MPRAYHTRPNPSCLRRTRATSFPSIDGFEDCWGRKVYHCLLCHGFEESGNATTIGILARDAFADVASLQRIVRACRQFSHDLTIYTHGNTRLAAHLQPMMAAHSSVRAIESKSIQQVRLTGPAGEGGIRVALSGGRQAEHGFLVYKPMTEQCSHLPEALALDMDEDGDIVVQPPFGTTSVPGVFAAGDCASGNKFFAAASVMGSAAGAGAAAYLQAKS